MALIIPTAASTYGDATTTGGGLRHYVLAQFRSDADLDWVQALRAALVTQELKWKQLLERRGALKKQRELWRSVERGVGQASIVVVSPGEFENAVEEMLANDRRRPAGDRRKAVVEGCATAVVAATPVAYLPDELAKAVRWGSYQQVASLEDFAPQRIRAEIGGGLRQAMVFAARAHATFDLVSLDGSVGTTRDVFRSPLARVALAELLATQRNFDEEDSGSVRLLNQAAEAIADTLWDELPVIGTRSSEPLVRQVSSQAIDEIQAADVAAGWARELLELAPPESLGGVFERVWINGRRIR